jgi:hypothetical protein
MDGTLIGAWSHNPILARFIRVAVACKDLQVVLNSRLCGVGKSRTILKRMLLYQTITKSFLPKTIYKLFTLILEPNTSQDMNLNITS